MNALPTGHALRGLLLASSLLIAPSAFAADATKIANDLVAAVEARGHQKASFESASAEGDDVVISNFKITGGRDNTITMPKLVVTAPQDRQPGGFTAARITADGGNGGDKDTVIAWKTAAMENAVVPSPAEITAEAKLTPFESLSVTEVSVAEGGRPPVTIAEIAATMTATAEGAIAGGTLYVGDIVVPKEVIAADEGTGEQLAELGYTDGLTLNVDLAGSYDDASQSLTLSSFSFEGAEMGKVAFSGSFGGLPRANLQDPKKADELAATVTIKDFTLRFDNAGLVERVLDMQGKAMGVTGAQFAEQIAGGLPLMLNFIGNPAFQEKVATAASTFLKAPKSLTITASPAAPVPVLQVVGAAQAAPQTIPDILSVGIDANK
ncbi:hypothetical protein [Prosthecomicrobium pneumaticum]|uniref:DUF2125 domain-containing protein n=1 Tax=Prosthecomicrobium pneumaticum TaxID=81895 RepID=A0A7W9CT03_9HYPH|nr:hypothetical protein [Prosthecomicrobium pneumaticum]MBB5751104.1 hypothetical protein [Prosthecomicrobium pneumaticum]